MLTEVTGPVSFYVSIQKYGFQELNKIKYTDFKFEETYPFKDLTTAEYCYLVQPAVPVLEEATLR